MCTWCGHVPHADACPREIQTGKGKRSAYVICPCVKRGEQ